MTRVPSAGMFFRRLHSLPSYSIYFGGLPVGLLFFVFFSPPFSLSLKVGATFIQTPPQRLGRFQYTILRSSPLIQPTMTGDGAATLGVCQCDDGHRCFLYGLGGTFISVPFRGHIYGLRCKRLFFFFVFVDLLSAFLRIPGVPDPACY